MFTNGPFTIVVTIHNSSTAVDSYRPPISCSFIDNCYDTEFWHTKRKNQEIIVSSWDSGIDFSNKDDRQQATTFVQTSFATLGA